MTALINTRQINSFSWNFYFDVHISRSLQSIFILSYSVCVILKKNAFSLLFTLQIIVVFCLQYAYNFYSVKSIEGHLKSVSNGKIHTKSEVRLTQILHYKNYYQLCNLYLKSKIKDLVTLIRRNANLSVVFKINYYYQVSSLQKSKNFGNYSFW